MNQTWTAELFSHLGMVKLPSSCREKETAEASTHGGVQSWLGCFSQESVDHSLDVAAGDSFLTGTDEPVAGVLVSM